MKRVQKTHLKVSLNIVSGWKKQTSMEERLMHILGVDVNKCNGCGECVTECPPRLFYQHEAEGKATYEEGIRICILCGHCIAVCPMDAVLFETKESDPVLEFDSQKSKSSDIITPDQLMYLFRMRRSVRRFKDESLSFDDVQSVLDAMRYAPTAKNLQALQYLVLSDKAVIKMLADKVLSFLRMTMRVSDTPGIGWVFRAILKDARLLKDPMVKEDMNRLFEGQDRGVDELFYDAPAVVIVHTRDTLGMGRNETGIAVAHGMIAAEVLGLGTCWIGYAQKVMNNSGGVRKAAGIPSGHIVTGVFVVGHPHVRYYRAPPRNAVKPTYVMNGWEPL
ncbi:MAG: nitroreductase family protein [Promethearchaeota archaeon]